MKKTLTLLTAATVMLAVAAPAAARTYISSKQAVAAAKAKVAGRVTDVDAEFDSRRPHYDVDIYSKRGRKHKIKVDARTGKVYANRIDYDD
ncbi:PepSY domain-containing protein [Neisseria dentiae]|uniref:PepSY domain-containing protein n=1 Tax=Neisseria dentiae TaxID=194197 RepID=UPI0035A0E77B